MVNFYFKINYIKYDNQCIIMSDISKTTINMPKELKKELKKIAIDKDNSLSGLILDIITEYVESTKKAESSHEDSY